MMDIAAAKVVVRVSEFAANTKSVDIELPPQCTVLQLKERVAVEHEKQPSPSHQRLVLLGKPLNDDKAVVAELIKAKGIDLSTVTTIHLVVSDKDPSTQQGAGSWTSAPSVSATRATVPAAIPSESSTATGSSATAGPSAPADSSATAAASASDSFGSPPPPPSPNTAPNAAAPSALPPPQSAPRVHARPMMHPIMAAAYNAALVELSDSCNQQRTHSNVIGANGRQQSIPFALSTPLHLSDASPRGVNVNAAQSAAQGIGTSPIPPPGQMIVINTNSVHLTGNNAESLANLISRANVRLRVVPNGQRVPYPAGGAGAAGDAAAAAAADAAAAAAAAAAGAARGAGDGARGAAGGGPAFQRNLGGGWRLQLQFQLNVMQLLRLGMAVLFMHSVMQMPTLRIVLLLTGYFVGRALIGMRLQRALTNWLDGLIAYTRQPIGQQQQQQQQQHQPQQQQPQPGAAAGAPQPHAAGGEPGGAAPAGAQPRAGVLWQIWVGVLSFFLSILPQFNADGADGAAIAAAQEDLDGAPNNNNGGGGGNQAAVF